MATNNNYWKERALEVENNSRSTAEIGRKEIEKIFAVTYSRLKKEINYWWHRFAVNNSLTLSEAKKLMKSKELEELDWDVEEYIKKGIEAAIVTLPEVDKQLENASAKVHINRLTALKLQVLVIANEMFNDVNKTVKDCMRKVYEDAYYTTAYNIQNGIGVYSDFNRINDRVLEQVLQRPWAEDGSNFSERIWGKQRPKLVNKIHKDLVDCVSRGRNPNEYTEELAKEFKVGLNQANNLIVTEYNYFNERATQDCMKELDVEEYEILGTLDGATCATCGGLDGKHYPLKDVVIGVNSPPFHPRCRCTTIPYFDDEFTENEERAYRGEDGKTHYTKAKTYEEWKREFVKEKGQDAWNLYEKGAKYRNSDNEQYQNYKDILGKNAPESLEEFQKIKYTNSEEWDKIKSKVQEELPKMDFDRMKLFIGTLSNRQTRLWYKYHDENIPNIIDKTKSLEEQAREACELRNTYRTQARDLMKDQEERKRLDSEHPNISFEELVEYKKLKYGLKGDAIYKDIIRSSQTTNKKYDKKAGLEE